MTVQTIIESKLQQQYNLHYLEVKNESHLHQVAKDAATHFKVTLVSDDLQNLSLIERQRQINQLLADELNNLIHALSLHTFTVQEWIDKKQSVAKTPHCRGGLHR
jgi:BolA family transcriptional regulator, general stress-responsive regulator